MQQITTYIFIFSTIVIIGHIFSQSIIPISLILVISGMFLSLIPNIPTITLNPDLVLNVFLPILIYQISSFSSWIDVKKNIRPISLLSIGHVLFITVLVAWVIHTLIPQLGWPLAFVLGAIISPPDDVAIVSIAEKIKLPKRIITILVGEGLLNDAMALILFKFALIASVTQQFTPLNAISNFCVLIVGETLYGIVLGNLIGKLRLRIRHTTLHMMASLLTPFLAYVPSLMMGGSGVLATAITGLVIGHRYSMRFSPEFRLVSRSLWPMLAFGIDCVIFLLVGLDMKSILNMISPIPFNSLVLYSMAVILTIILGRFFWVYVAVVFLPRFLFPFITKKDPYPPWQYPFIISWAGMRGGISLAAALAVPLLPNVVEGVNPRVLLIFLVFCVITVTFVVQGLTLPWLIKKIGVQKLGQYETYSEHLLELYARKKMATAVIYWLKEYKNQVKDNSKLLDQIKIYLLEYKMIKSYLKERIEIHDSNTARDSIISKHDEQEEVERVNFLLSQIIEVERSTLMALWEKEKISFDTRNRLIEKLDHHVKHLPG